ncbi:MAG: DUF3048 domain-containing protein [Clostridiales bacterium]|nr:DUF3048 domain-containing protein [Clostridiales bacterium]
MSIKNKDFLKRILCITLLSACVLTIGCGDKNNTDDTDDGTSGPIVSDDVMTDNSTDDTEPVTDAPDTSAPDTSSPDTSAVDTEPPVVIPSEPEFINPLTGLEADEDYSDRRPAAIMINNIKVATPQEGISYADVMYECLVEGWQTRLMMVTMDYENLPVVGSVRSSREYYLDFAANHDAIYIHAGGSNQAYVEMSTRKVDHLDGVNNPVPNMFYRDSWRQKNMGFEHSLMTDGKRIADAIATRKLRTDIVDDFDSPLDFVPYDTTRELDGGDATYLMVKYSGAHHPHFEYDEKENVYYRWQFLGDKHIDNTAKKQLSFTNIIVLYMQSVQTSDEYKHMDITTTGTGDGYYLYGGKYEKITWSKKDEDTPVKLYGADGEELLINRGKTFFQICTTSMKDTTEIK